MSVPDVSITGRFLSCGLRDVGRVPDRIFERDLNRGFTLIEILVVVVVVAIAMSVVLGTFSSADRNQEYTGFMQRLATKIEMARDKAVQRNREWGIHIDESEIAFSEYDPVNEVWVVQSQRPFNSGEYARQLEFSVEVESFAGIDVSAESFSRSDDGFSLEQNNRREREDAETDFPDVVLFSSGEVTPFEITAQPKDWDAQPAVLVSDGFTRTRIAQDDEI